MALTDIQIACYELEEVSGTRNDAHGTNHLADNNTVLQGTGTVGNGADFTAANSESLSLADSPALSMGAGVDFTIAFFVKFKSLAAAMVMVGKWSGGETIKEYMVRYVSATSRITFHTNSVGNSENSVEASTFGAPSIDTPYFVVVWFDTTANTINIQIDNGAVDSSVENEDGIRDDTATFYLGRREDGEYLDGLLDQVCVWKRVLTSDERTEMYNGGAGLSYAAMSGPAPQKAYPTADSVDGGWTPSTGTDLFAVIDEVTTDDADYMKSNTGAAADAATVTLGSIDTPDAGTVTVTVRHRTGG